MAVVAVLLEAGADASITTKKGTVLGCAKQSKELGHTEIVSLLEAHFKQYPEGVKPITAMQKDLSYENNLKSKAGEKESAFRHFSCS